MEVKSSDDVTVNSVTARELLKPLIEFIQEHEGEKTRTSIMDAAIKEIAYKSKICPHMAIGSFMVAIMDINRDVDTLARRLTLAGEKAIIKD